MNMIIALAGILLGVYLSGKTMEFRTTKRQLYLGYAAIWLFALGFYWELVASWSSLSQAPEVAVLSGFWCGTDREAMFVRFFLPFWSALVACIFIENSYWKEGETPEQRQKRKAVKIKRFCLFGLVLFLIDLVYVWLR